MTTRSGYVAKVALVFLFTLADLMFNATADHNDRPDAPAWTHAVWIGVQFMIQLLNFLTIFMLFFGTYLFQVGLIGEVLREFRSVTYAMGVYALVFAGYAGCKLGYVFRDKLTVFTLWDEPLFIFMSIFQKAAAMGYYLLILHTCVRLGDAKWYARSPWVAKYSQQYSAVPVKAGAGSS